MDVQQIYSLFSNNIRSILMESEIHFERLYEIRMRVGRPVFLIYDCGERFLQGKGKRVYTVTPEDLRETLQYASGYSLYAYEDEIRQGYLSIAGGHRIGVTGKVILDGERIRTMKYISCVNIRLAHQVKDCARGLLPFVRGKGWIANTLIVSPPRCGKTTVLRDLIRLLSNGDEYREGVTVGVVDERGELGGCYQGIPQNDLGMRTDILDGCPKALGMQILLRSMSPAVIAVDELGREEDYRAVESVIHCGCKLLATAHGASLEEVLSKPLFERLLQQKVFERYIVLHKTERAGMLQGVYDGKGKSCLKQSG